MTPAWCLLLGAGLYVVGHFAVSLIVVRRLAVFRQERGIFLYHGVAFALLAMGAEAAVMPRAVVGALSLHAIYSMSFLEAWSLSQISYSIAILDALEARGVLDGTALTARFAAMGTAKKASRLSSLQNLRLIRVQGGHAVLTPPGRAAATSLLALRWIANLREIG